MQTHIHMIYYNIHVPLTSYTCTICIYSCVKQLTPSWASERTTAISMYTWNCEGEREREREQREISLISSHRALLKLVSLNKVRPVLIEIEGTMYIIVNAPVQMNQSFPWRWLLGWWLVSSSWLVWRTRRAQDTGHPSAVEQDRSPVSQEPVLVSRVCPCVWCVQWACT